MIDSRTGTGSGRSPMGFGDRLTAAVEEKKSCLVVGLDPVLDRLPADCFRALGALSPGGEGLTAKASAAFGLFLREVIDVVADVAVAVKPNTAYFERYGAAGWECLLQVCRHANKAGLLVIADAKRGDVAHTAHAYAEALLGDTPDTVGPHVDAVTLNPYLGTDSVQPYLEIAKERGKGLFLLVKTSNPSSGELQDLPVDGRPLSCAVAERVSLWGKGLKGESGLGPVGAVVGATAPEQAGLLRELLPEAPLLIPGVGAQGGRPEDLLPYFLPGGLGAIVNSSRSILFAYGQQGARPGWADAVRQAAIETRDSLERVRAEA